MGSMIGIAMNAPMFGGGGASFASTVTDIPEAEAQALIDLYNATNGASWTNRTNWLETTTAGNWNGVTVSGGHVTQIILSSNNLVGSIADWDASALSSMLTLRLNSNSSLTGDLTTVQFNDALVNIWLNTTKLSGNMASFTFPTDTRDFRVNSTNVTGTLPTLPSSLQSLFVHLSKMSGDIEGLAVPASVVTFSIYGTGLYGTPDLSAASALDLYSCYNCNLSQPRVDAILSEVYDNREVFTSTSPTLSVGGNNAAPSGAAVDEDPPTTGLGYAYELAYDPESEGFNTWTVGATGITLPFSDGGAQWIDPLSASKSSSFWDTSNIAEMN